MSAVDPMCFSALGFEAVQKFDPAACGGISNAQLSQMATIFPADACAGFLPSCLTRIASLAGMNGECAWRLTVEACGL